MRPTAAWDGPLAFDGARELAVAGARCYRAVICFDDGVEACAAVDDELYFCTLAAARGTLTVLLAGLDAPRLSERRPGAIAAWHADLRRGRWRAAGDGTLRLDVEDGWQRDVRLTVARTLRHRARQAASESSR